MTSLRHYVIFGVSFVTSDVQFVNSTNI